MCEVTDSFNPRRAGGAFSYRSPSHPAAELAAFLFLRVATLVA